MQLMVRRRDPHHHAVRVMFLIAVWDIVMSISAWTKSIIQEVTRLEFHTVHWKLKAKDSAAFGWAIKELSFLGRHVAIELYRVTGGLMLCDRKQMRCALTALLCHCWMANVRSQTAYAHDGKSLGCAVCVRLDICADHHVSAFDTWAHVNSLNGMLEYSACYSGL